MEILELPATEEIEEVEWGESAAPKFDEQEFMAAFELWKQASRPDPEE